MTLFKDRISPSRLSIFRACSVLYCNSFYLLLICASFEINSSIRSMHIAPVCKPFQFDEGYRYVSKPEMSRIESISNGIFGVGKQNICMGQNE